MLLYCKMKHSFRLEQIESNQRAKWPGKKGCWGDNSSCLHYKWALIYWTETLSLIQLLANVHYIILMLPLSFSLHLSACLSRVGWFTDSHGWQLQTGSATAWKDHIFDKWLCSSSTNLYSRYLLWSLHSRFGRWRLDQAICVNVSSLTCG